MRHQLGGVVQPG